ncbi:diguanylate cyclase (GGDEF) domain-containing protein [Nitrosomonas marina]|uniref:diguanylate cyclase n=1 Tax=Nitrosomonas marina TaxID=917 RepID=A0A1I0ARU4_9PROT|nr:GGDEF domain-containing protein [Nitrosomonas marina]SES96877.1 diguanylate cyclase (GGDEF) domain-containing protein [Nitrosomonas marina]
MRSLIFPKINRLKLPENQYANHIYWLFLFLSSISIFLFDLLTPLGVAAGTPYALIVFASIWLKDNWSTYVTTVTGFFLTLTGVFLSPYIVAPMDVVVTNRLLALLIITITAYMVLKIKRINYELDMLVIDTNVDPLTQCKNSRAFKEETKTEIKRSKRYKRNLSLAIFDISDSSSTTNTTENSAIHIDNQYIKTLADEIRKSIRSSDQLYRIDLNRFAVVYVETDISKAKDATEALCKRFYQLNQNDTEHDLSVNVGITMLNDKDHIWKLYNRAEDALAKAKQNGKNHVATLPETYRSDKSHIPAILCRPRSG